MSHAICPVCGCNKFYVKNPEDEYDIYEFECRNGKICFEESIEDDECPEINDSTRTYCNKCAWHDTFEKLK